MISYIKGIAAYVDSEGVIVENHGIGYQIKTPSSIVEQVKSGQEVMLHTHLYVREDVLALFGFMTKQELNTFQTLLSITGIGPKVALSILSTMTVADLYYAVFSEDAKSIAKTPGIGPKGAKRMIIELKDKLKMEDITPGMEIEETAVSTSIDSSDHVADTIEAMVALGYSNGEAYRAVHGVKGAADMDSEQLLKEALKVVLTLR
ncbi:MAG: Holliday junction branch migration protein RuvA [Eubacteriales bacterium]|nr:Holliday junction branch migration protein RuvA [Eubacteriales bacterium]